MTDWLSATAMILSGAIVGFMFWYGMKSRAPKPDLERLDLEAKRDVLLQQLRELKETGGSIEEQRRLERETADTLRRIDQITVSDQQLHHLLPLRSFFSFLPRPFVSPSVFPALSLAGTSCEPPASR